MKLCARGTSEMRAYTSVCSCTPPLAHRLKPCNCCAIDQSIANADSLEGQVHVSMRILIALTAFAWLHLECAAAANPAAQERFSEELLLRPLPGELVAVCDFYHLWSRTHLPEGYVAF